MSPMTYIEVLEKIKKIAILILNFPFGRRNTKNIFGKEVIELLREAAENSESNRRKKNFGVIGGSATGVVGGALAITGAALIPFTFGASVGLLAAGTAVSVIGASVSIGFSLDKFFRDKDRGRLVEPALEKYVNFQKNVLTTMVNVKVVLDVVPPRIRLDQTMPRRIGLHICRIREELNELKDQVELEDTFDADQLIKDLCYFAEQIIETLVEVSSLVGDTRYDRTLREKIKQKPFSFLGGTHFELAVEEEALVGGRTFYNFARRIYEVRPNNEIDESPLLGTAATTGNVTAKGGATGGALGTRVAFQIANFGDDAAKAGSIAIRVVKGVSIAGVVLGAIGVVVDIGFLGHAIYDLKSGKPEEFASALEEVADFMNDINNLNVF